jgi:hypothetical protein
MLARQDGGKPSLSWERYKVRAACLAAEQRYGLRSTAPADRTAARQPTRAETEKASREGLDEAPRITLRRQVTTAAASAGSEDEFFARLDQVGVPVRKRFSVKNPSQVTGYSVALPGDTTKDGGPIWYGGGKLAADLTWPKLQQRWTPHRATPGPGRLTAEERNAVWDHATRVAADAAAQIRAMARTDPAAAADAAWASRQNRPPPSSTVSLAKAQTPVQTRQEALATTGSRSPAVTSASADTAGHASRSGRWRRHGSPTQPGTLGWPSALAEGQHNRRLCRFIGAEIRANGPPAPPQGPAPRWPGR